MQPTSDHAQRLIAELARFDRIIVAFSGGVDSSVVAAAAVRAAPRTAIAITARSPSVAGWQLETARRVAGEIGIAHRVIATDEWERDAYRRNDLRRCFYCKETLYEHLCGIPEAADSVILSGTNADDLGDYRPGIEAGRAAGVRTPLADLGLGKADVRELARELELSNAELPASPCLASRIAYGVAVTPERLSRVEAAEQWLRERGVSDVRVRVHQDELARIELPSDELARFAESGQLGALHEALRGLGFRFVAVDAGGLRSGSLTPQLVSIRTTGSAESPDDEARP